MKPFFCAVYFSCVVACMVSALTIQQATLQAHNNARRTEAKAATATNMYELVWDADLARTAQTWADNCVFKHQTSHAFGENLFWRTPIRHGDDYYINLAVQDWMAEKSHNPDGSFDCCSPSAHTCCHYTQCVNAKTKSVGCGVGHCDNLKNANGDVVAHNAAFVVCDYKPPGNVFMHGNHEAYANGTKICSACAHGDTCNDGLCVTSN